jgi:hypothetical protein
VVQLHYLSWTGMAGKVEFDGNPRRRRRGRRRRRCSGGECWPRSCAREPVSHWDHVDTINRKNGHWIKGNRRRPMRRRRGRTPASVGKELWCTRELMDGLYSFRVMMWCCLGGRGGVGVPGESCPRWRPKAAATALVGGEVPVRIG